MLLREEVPADRALGVTRWRRCDRVLWRVVLDDAVVLPVHGPGEPFAVAGGRKLWEALAEERSLEELADLLGAAASEQDLVDLLDSLSRAGVVERRPG